MNLELRNLHARVFQWLRFLLPAILLVGLLGYRFPVSSKVPQSPATSLPGNAQLQSTDEFEFGDYRFRMEMLRASSAAMPGIEDQWVRVTALTPLRQPDLLVYWSAREATYEEPPIGAHLLGIFDPRAPASFRLPSSASVVRGHLVIYSLGQNVLIGQTQLPSPF